MQTDENTASEKPEGKQVAGRRRGELTHEQAEGAVPEDLTVAGEEDGGVGIEHWWEDDEAGGDPAKRD